MFLCSLFSREDFQSILQRQKIINPLKSQHQTSLLALISLCLSLPSQGTHGSPDIGLLACALCPGARPKYHSRSWQSDQVSASLLPCSMSSILAGLPKHIVDTLPSLRQPISAQMCFLKQTGAPQGFIFGSSLFSRQSYKKTTRMQKDPPPPQPVQSPVPLEQFALP